jgi:hypothetical protein
MAKRRKEPRVPLSTTDTTLPADWWAIEHVIAYLAGQGRPIAASTWTAYVARGDAPAPDRRFGRSPAWSPRTIRQWQAQRRGRGWRSGQTGGRP